MHRELISYLPPKLRDKVIYKEVCNAEENEFKLLFSNIDCMANDIFISDLTVEGLKRWERDLKITHLGTDTLEDRRFRILNRFLNKLPYTMRTLEKTLDTLVGENGYKLEYNQETFTLTININLTVKNQLQEVKRTLYYMVPANIKQDIKLLYNSHLVLSKYTHRQLSQYTHRQLREEVL